MKKLQTIAFAATLGFLLLQIVPAHMAAAQNTPKDPAAVAEHSSPQIDAGAAIFRQHCAFCHGRDAAGGESGPDLTRSKLVAADVDGNKIAPVIHNGRPEKGMPPFTFSDGQVASVVAFIHAQVAKAQAQTQTGGRRGVDVADLQTGNVAAGKQYFYGAGGCSHCHSPTGDLAGVATRHEGLALERCMLYPEGAESKVTVTLASGRAMTGELAYRDEFTVALRDDAGVYHSWPVDKVKYAIDSPADAHVRLLDKYTDDDIHNLMAYIQTLR
ncbi:MAG: cytochrome c [Acidobacteriaceae bacterium]